MRYSSLNGVVELSAIEDVVQITWSLDARACDVTVRVWSTGETVSFNYDDSWTILNVVLRSHLLFARRNAIVFVFVVRAIGCQMICRLKSIIDLINWILSKRLSSAYILRRHYSSSAPNTWRRSLIQCVHCFRNCSTLKFTGISCHSIDDCE